MPCFSRACISHGFKSRRLRAILRFVESPLSAVGVQVAEMKARLEGRRQELIDLRNGYDSDDETHYVVDSRTGEVVLSVKEVIQ